MEILVTGGVGFLGSHLVRRLVKEGHSVTVLDKSKKDINRIADVKDKIKFIEKDVRKFRECSKFDLVYHLVAISDVTKCEEDPKEALSVNVGGTLNLLLQNPKKLVYPSSAAIYAEKGKRVIHFYDRINPKSIYGYTKKWAEELVDKFDQVVVRIPNVYGPYSPSVITKFVKRALEGKELIVYGDGEQMRTFIYVDDIVNALVKIGMEGRREFYQLGASSKFYKSVNDVIKVLKKKLPIKKVVYKPEREYETRYSLLAYERSDLELRPKIELEQGIDKLIKFYK